MNFTQEEAVEKLNGILTNGGKKPLRMSEISLKKQLETLLPIVATDDMSLDDFVEKVKVSFETMNSNAEHDKSLAYKEFEEKNKGAKQETTPPIEKKEGDGGDKYDALLEEIKALREKVDASDKEKAVASKKQELSQAMEAKGVTDKEWIDKLFSEISISDDFDVEAKAEVYSSLYKSSKSSLGDGLTPRSTSRGESNNREEERWKRISDAHKRELEEQQSVI